MEQVIEIRVSEKVNKNKRTTLPESIKEYLKNSYGIGEDDFCVEEIVGE